MTYTVWTKHVKDDPVAKDAFENSLRSAKHVLERLKDIIQEEEDGLARAEMNPKIYDLPNWDYKQAHGNGFRAGLNFVNKLVNLDQQNRTTK